MTVPSAPLSLSAPTLPLLRPAAPERFPLEPRTLVQWSTAAAAAVLRGGHDRSREQRKRGKGSDSRAVLVNGQPMRAVKPDASPYEVEALAAEVLVRVVAAHGPTPDRSRVGMTYLRTLAHNVATEDGSAGRGWQDSAASYRSRAAADRGDASMIRRMPADETDSADPLVRAIAARMALSGDPLPVIPADAVELADAVADALPLDGLTAGEDRAVRVALLRAGMAAEGDESAPLARIADELGCSLITAKRDSAKGGAVIRARVPAALLASVIADVADRMRSVMPADPYRPTLDRAGMLARVLVEACQGEARKRAGSGARGGATVPGGRTMGSTRSLRFSGTTSGTAAVAERERQQRAARIMAGHWRAAFWSATVSRRASEGHGWAVLAAAR